METLTTNNRSLSRLHLEKSKTPKALILQAENLQKPDFQKIW